MHADCKASTGFVVGGVFGALLCFVVISTVNIWTAETATLPEVEDLQEDPLPSPSDTFQSEFTYGQRVRAVSGFYATAPGGGVVIGVLGGRDRLVLVQFDELTGVRTVREDQLQVFEPPADSLNPDENQGWRGPDDSRLSPTGQPAPVGGSSPIGSKPPEVEDIPPGSPTAFQHRGPGCGAGLGADFTVN